MKWLKLLKGNRGSEREMSVWVQLTGIKASGWAHHNFHFQSKTIFYHGFAIMVCTRPVTVTKTTVFLGPIPATSWQAPDMFYEHMSHTIVLRLHLDYFDKLGHTKTLLQFSLHASFLLPSTAELFVRDFMLSWRQLLFAFLGTLLTVGCWSRKVKVWV